LGLEDFGYKLHDMEAELKKLRQMDHIDFKNMLHITVNIEKIFQEQDKFNTIIEKLQLFNVRGSRNQFNAESMFTESFKRACERIAKELQKNVRLQIDIEPLDLKNIPRREIKETLIQLIRNAVYHGIESPAERTAAGKNEVGTIALAMELENDNLHIILKDDGRGLDFNHIRKKAEEKRLINKTSKVDKNYLIHILFMPGFSTSDSEGAYAGRGIGLSLVRARIHDLHGTIKLQSIQGKGTIFTISIPLETELAINQVS
jgi:chemotaxis protein histidine kinase CheA